MKTILLSSLLGCTSMFALAQGTPEKQFDREHTLDLLVVYDDSEWQYAENYENARETFAQEVVNSLNRVMENSRIDYRYRVAGTYHWAGYKAPTIEMGLDDATWNEDIRTQRRRTKADIVLFLTENQDVNSGAANPSAQHTDAFACVRRSMAASAYTAAHEIGHILGANHSDQPGEPQPSAHPWAKAYVSPEGLMTVLCSMGTCVPIYSGPQSVWTTDDNQQIVMGDATHDNVRMIKRMLPAAVHFGDYLDAEGYYTSQQRFVYDKNAGKGQVSLYSNSFFQVRSTADWLTIDKGNGSGPVNGTFFGNGSLQLEFSLQPNHTGQTREADLELFGCDYPERAIRVHVVQTAAEVNLDGDGGTYSLAAPTYVESVQISRHFDDTEWQPLYLPLQWRYEDWQQHFDVAELKAVKRINDGEALLLVTPLTSGATKENTPYLIRAKQAGDYALPLQHYTLFPAVGTTTEFTTDGQVFRFTGTYEEIAGQDMFNNGYYSAAQGTIAPTADVNARLGAFRWYLQLTDRNGQALPAPLKINIIEQKDDATGIENITRTPATFNVYDLNGRLVKKNADGTEGLENGVYIVNGKKVVF